jgi:uncharacterized membrane protein YqgA involved in biofilm formation
MKNTEGVRFKKRTPEYFQLFMLHQFSLVILIIDICLALSVNRTI